jgi:hypothetical protein
VCARVCVLCVCVCVHTYVCMHIIYIYIHTHTQVEILQKAIKEGKKFENMEVEWGIDFGHKFTEKSDCSGLIWFICILGRYTKALH